MNIKEHDEIAVLAAQCKLLEAQLSEKRDELQKAVIRKLTNDGRQHPLASFLGKMATYDRPNKWGKPSSFEFTEAELNSRNYLKFNGIVTGEEVNKLYDMPIYKKSAQFYSFVIPEEWADELVDGEPVPINMVYELMIFEIR